MTEENRNKIDYEKIKDQYKIAVETADKTTDRRYNFNRLMIIVVGALLTVIATLAPSNTIFIIPVVIIGIFVCTNWEKQIDCFKFLVKMKYDTIKQIEKEYPNDICNVYIDEGKKRDNDTKFKSLSEQEKGIVKVFKIGFILYLCIIIVKELIIISPALMIFRYLFS